MVCQMVGIRTRIAESGRIVIPAEYRKALGLQPGDDVIVRLEGQEVRVLSLREAVRQAQELVRQFVPAGVSLVDELIAERRAEAEGE